MGVGAALEASVVGDRFVAGCRAKIVAQAAEGNVPISSVGRPFRAVATAWKGRPTRNDMRPLRTISIFPTMFTLGNLVCGFFAIVVASRISAPTLPAEITPADLEDAAVVVLVGAQDRPPVGAVGMNAPDTPATAVAHSLGFERAEDEATVLEDRGVQGAPDVEVADLLDVAAVVAHSHCRQPVALRLRSSSVSTGPV